jgi:pimeloyl-ACP methyl ester carboxylesterase
VFSCLYNQLKNEFTITAVDFYGFGCTPHPSYPLQLRDYALSVVELINHYRMSNVILIGHSFGGKVALMLTTIHGHLVDRLILINSSGIRPRRHIKYYFNIYYYKLCKIMHIERSNAGSVDYKALSGAMKKTFVNIVNYHLNAKLRYITHKTLILWSRYDSTTPLYMARKLKRGLKASSLVIMDSTSHYLFLDRSSESLAEIKRFLGDVNDN